MTSDEQSADAPHARPAFLAAATVMIVDDQEANLALLERILDDGGVGRVISVRDPIAAIARCVQLPPDLLVLDLHMPEMDGFGVMAELKRELGDERFLPILVLTADVTRSTRERALLAGAKDFVTKPFDRIEIMLRVSNLIETASLYQQVASDNERLRRELEAERAEERRGVRERRDRLDRVERLLAADDLTIAFQPVVDLFDGEVVGAEALARFPSAVPRPPNLWFDDAHAVGLGDELEVRAIERAIEQLRGLPAGAFLAVNVSPSVVASPMLLDALSRCDGRRIVVELTEHSRIEEYESLIASLDALRLQGIRVAVDDAGAGYAGLRHILRLRPDLLKMDIELIRGIDTDPARRALAAALRSFADEIGAVVVAEGVETAAELETLRGLDVRFGQGYHLARPGPLPLAVDAIAALIRTT
jgi:EAL domain-containing protein (putative c-di-GMP-specific phosphodiesterase class I)/AmiR/NasT family two-component response regulator